jgi:hypothetical protein
MQRHEAGGPTFPCSVCSAELTTKYELCLHSKSHGIFPKKSTPKRRNKTQDLASSRPRVGSLKLKLRKRVRASLGSGGSGRGSDSDRNTEDSVPQYSVEEAKMEEPAVTAESS